MDIKVYYEDTDAGGVMYHASHIRFMERVRTELVALMGISVEELHTRGLYFVVTRINIRYRNPARLGDVLTVSAEPVKIKNFSMTIMQNILRGDDPIAEAEVAIALRDKDGPVLLPKDALKRLGKD